jgi:hypothetical protein
MYIALGKGRDKVSNLVLSKQDLTNLILDPTNKQNITANNIAFIDPNQRLFMYYPQETLENNAKGILKDLRRLLKYSQTEKSSGKA